MGKRKQKDSMEAKQMSSYHLDSEHFKNLLQDFKEDVQDGDQS